MAKGTEGKLKRKSERDKEKPPSVRGKSEPGQDMGKATHRDGKKKHGPGGSGTSILSELSKNEPLMESNLLDQLLLESPVQAEVQLPTSNDEVPARNSEYQLKMCKEIVEEYWGTAWKICAERFFQGNAPSLVCLELRDTWLRMLEAEWLDQDQSMEEMPPDMFKADDPPLPLAYDTWARGNLEMLPNSRRESVIDPFLRDDLKPFGAAGGDWSLTPAVEAPVQEEIKKVKKKKPKVGKDAKVKGRSKSRSRKSATEKPKEKPKIPRPRKGLEETDPEIPISEAHSVAEIAKKIVPKPGKSKLKFNETKKDTKRSKGKKVVLEVPEVIPEIIEPEVAIAIPPTDHPVYPVSSDICDAGEELEGEYSDEGFVPDFPYVCAEPKLPVIKPEYSLEILREPPRNYPPSPTMSRYYEDVGLQPWSPSQCGGVNKSGIFRLPTETSSQAVLKKKQLEEAEMAKFTPDQAYYYEYAGEGYMNYEFDGEDAYNHAHHAWRHAEHKRRLQSVLVQAHAKTIASRINNLEHAGSDELVQILAPHESMRFTARDSHVDMPESADDLQLHQEGSKKFTLELTSSMHENIGTTRTTTQVQEKAGKRKTSILNMKDKVIKNTRDEMNRRFSSERLL